MREAKAEAAILDLDNTAPACGQTRTPALDAVLDAGVSELAPRRIDGIAIGTLLALEQDGRARVAVPGLTHPPLPPARSLCPLDAGRIGAECAISFEAGDLARPVVLGFVHHPAEIAPACKEQPTVPPEPRETRDATIDGKRITFDAQEEIVLRCGQASITLTRAGKVLIRGAYVLSRSSGANRIKGGSVQIN